MIVVLLCLNGYVHIDCNWEINLSFCCIIRMSHSLHAEGRAPVG